MKRINRIGERSEQQKMEIIDDIFYINTQR